jgi:hypothetical protein
MTTFPVITTTFAEYEKFSIVEKLQFWATLPENVRLPSDWGGNWFVHTQAAIAEALRVGFF